jgi:hypothetical protein
MTDVYEKAVKVIDSCENQTHLDGAINYCNNFKNQFTKMGYDDVLIGIYYKKLMEQLSDKISETYIN